MTRIYQTLEDRGNYEEVEAHGPYFCSYKDEKGRPKKGVKEPWLGEGFYFWDTRIEDAHWWGDQAYNGNGYMICQTYYNQNSKLLYDTVGDISQLDELVDCAKLLRVQYELDKITIPFVLGHLKKRAGFNYKAIRMCPDPNSKTGKKQSHIVFPGDKATLFVPEKIQICFFDRTLLDQPFKVVFPSVSALNKDFTI